jgi:hypothetical protein
MEARLVAHGGASAPGAFSAAMGESMMLPAAVIMIGFLAAIFLVAPKHLTPAGR